MAGPYVGPQLGELAKGRAPDEVRKAMAETALAVDELPEIRAEIQLGDLIALLGVLRG